MSRKEKITNDLLEIGACYATTDAKTILPSDGFGAIPTYHIHPDASSPRQDSILTFSTLDDLEGYIAACKQAAGTDDVSRQVDIMQEYWMR